MDSNRNPKGRKCVILTGREMFSVLGGIYLEDKGLQKSQGQSTLLKPIAKNYNDFPTY